MITVTKTKHVCINDNDISFCTTEKGLVEIGLKDGSSHYQRRPIKQLAKELPHLIKTGNKCLVSPDMVEKFEGQTITLVGGRTFPVSRGFKKVVKERLDDFNMENESSIN